jgi:hypothetical protein
MRRGIIFINDRYAEFGQFYEESENIRLEIDGQVVWGISYEKLKDHIGFNYSSGHYVLGKDINTDVITFGGNPYNLDNGIYNMKFMEHLFRNKQKCDNLINFKYIDELPYTFGLEFETAGGYLPQHRLYELGLIPLRDGSITGLEFSTVVLQNNTGLNLLKQQINELKEHTVFDKDCSLHIHFGNFKLDGNVLLNINNIFNSCGLLYYVPSLSFETHQYKTNKEKNYCEFNTKYKTFQDLYKELVGRSFYGDFKQPHPKDLTGTRKWNIKSRYKAINFINALCYNGPKTVEYRFLRPTDNFDKILGWLFIFGGIIKYAEQNSENIFYRQSIDIISVLKNVYSSELADILCKFLQMSYSVVITQNRLGDRFGMRVDVDDCIINYNSFGHYFY